MKINSYKKLKNNTYKVILEDNNEIILYDEIILKYNLLLKKELNQKELVGMIKENRFYSCYYEAIKYLNYKNRSKKEVSEYLKKKNYSLEEIEKNINLLEEKKWINEELYLKNFIEEQILLTNNGPKKITRKLLNLGFLEDKIKEELIKVPKEVWKEKLKKIITKKIQSNRKDGPNKIKEKILVFCLNDGFSKEDILDIIENYELPLNVSALQKEAIRLYKKLSLKYEGTALFYQIKGRLARRGFSLEEIETVIKDIKKSSE